VPEGGQPDRYSIGSETPGLVRGADDSLTIVMSASRPTQTDVNWLPAPTGAFSLVLRVYDPTPQVLGPARNTGDQLKCGGPAVAAGPFRDRPYPAFSSSTQ
jgi:hypothetical protein